jgi:dTDP-3-amino-3,4,6-trideoxy-alpha-D-glucose transaminase
VSGVPFYSLQRQHAELRAELDSATARVIDSGRMILGRELEQFETAFAAYCGVRHAIGVGNGLDALTLILRALGVGPGSEVIVPGHTFIATWLAAEQVGATIVPVDIDPQTFNIDAAAVELAITARTRAIVAVHLYGQPGPMASLRQIGDRRAIPVIEDAAQAHGATYGGTKAGALATAAAFSFYPTKNLGALGDAGAVTTNNDEVAQRVRRLRNYGSLCKYEHEQLGVNSRLDELQAAYLCAKLLRLDQKNQRRSDIAGLYQRGLVNLPGVVLPRIPDGRRTSWHLYVLRVAQRDELQRELAARGIGTLIHYPIPPHRQPAYAGTALGQTYLPNTERAAREVLSLPMWPELTNSEVERVIESVREAAIALQRQPA